MIEIVLLEKMQSSADVSLINAYEKFSGRKLVRLNICHKLRYNGIIFTTHKNLTKRCDSCFISEKNEIGLIDCFFFLTMNKFFVCPVK